jgi:hypothetical protein
MAEAAEQVKNLSIAESATEATPQAAVEPAKAPGKKREPKPTKDKPAQTPKEKKPQQKKKTEVGHTSDTTKDEMLTGINRVLLSLALM